MPIYEVSWCKYRRGLLVLVCIHGGPIFRLVLQFSGVEFLVIKGGETRM